MDTYHSHENLSHGEKFVYRSHSCEITYDGLRPNFFIDERNAEKVLDNFEVTPDSVGRSDWKFTLMREIDKMKGEDVTSVSYIEPKRRLRIRTIAQRYIDYLAPEFGYKKSHQIIENSKYENIFEISDAVQDQVDVIIENGDHYGIEAFDVARHRVFTEIIQNSEVVTD